MKTDRIIAELLSYKNKTISLEKMAQIISDNNIERIKEFNTFKYDEFAEIVTDLIDSGTLSPKGINKFGKPKKGTTDGRKHNLSLNYDIVKSSETQVMPKEYTDEIKWLNPKINTNKAIFKNMVLYSKYRWHIMKINEYLKDIRTKEVISVNERSYELFGDEKFLSGQDKEDSFNIGFIQMLGLTPEDLYCRYNYEPLLVFASSTFYVKAIRTILIVENLDTFWSFQRIIFKDRIIKEVDMIIYGAGNKITGGISTYEQYEINSNDKILYYGDIDSAGFDFYLQIKSKYPLQIELFKTAYELLINSTLEKDKRKNRGDGQNVLAPEKLSVILAEFPSIEHKSIIKKLISDHKYIPQEGLNYAILKERWPVNG